MHSFIYYLDATSDKDYAMEWSGCGELRRVAQYAFIVFGLYGICGVTAVGAVTQGK